MLLLQWLVALWQLRLSWKASVARYLKVLWMHPSAWCVPGLVQHGGPSPKKPPLASSQGHSQRCKTVPNSNPVAPCLEKLLVMALQSLLTLARQANGLGRHFWQPPPFQAISQLRGLRSGFMWTSNVSIRVAQNYNEQKAKHAISLNVLGIMGNHGSLMGRIREF